MADADEVVPSTNPAKRKPRMPLLIGLAFLLLVVGAGGYWVMTKQGATGLVAAGTGGATKAAMTEVYLPLQPVFVVNFRDEQSVRYLQIGVTLMSHDEAAINVAKRTDPVIRDALVSLFSNQDYTIISDASGRQNLQAKALASVRKIVQERLGRPGIDALYFTSFVMQ